MNQPVGKKWAQPRRVIVDSVKKVSWNLSLIVMGSILTAVAINGILIPRQFLSGGFTGLALIIHYLLPAFPVGWLYLVLNLPNYVVGWKFVGRRFFAYSILGLIVFSASLMFVRVHIPLQDKLLSALLAGIISGVGAGIILRSYGSAGGTDILSVMLMKRFSIRLGTSILAFNAVILVAAAVLFTLEGALYTLIYLYVGSHVIDLVVTGMSQRKAVYIVSSHWEAIAKGIMNDLQRGVTVIRGEGAYSGQEHRILYSVITFRELGRLKEMIRRIDSNAFVVVTDTLEVMGQRIGNQPHW